MPTDDYQTVKEVTGHLTAVETTVRQQIRPAGLRAISIGMGWRIADGGLERCLEIQQSAPCAASEAGQRKDT